MNNSHNDIFDNNAAIAELKTALDFAKFSIESLPAVEANEILTAEKARLTNKNRVTHLKRLNKLQALPDSALTVLVGLNMSADNFEGLAAYAKDKVVQFALFIAGNNSVFGRGKNNTLLYAFKAIAAHSPAIFETGACRAQLERYGQPSSSSQTQASSSMKALSCLNFAKEVGRGKYQINYDNAALQSVLDAVKAVK